MLIIVAGMQKAGSGWLFNLLNDLVIESGGLDAREARARFGLDAFVRHHNCNAGVLTSQKLERLLRASDGTRFAVKTHARPTSAVRQALARHDANAVYIFRDPRDVALSAYEHGGKLRGDGYRYWSFAKLRTLELSIAWTAARPVPVARKWLQLPDVRHLTYGTLSADVSGVLASTSKHLGLDVDGAAIRRIAERYDARTADEGTREFLHYNKAGSARYASQMTSRQRALCESLLGGLDDELQAHQRRVVE
jgi:hypothetical protein